MITKTLLAACYEHPDCTVKMGFVPLDDQEYDMAVDSKPVPHALYQNARNVFGAVYCVDIEHIDGILKVEVES